jgi:hypothetical protein
MNPSSSAANKTGIILSHNTGLGDLIVMNGAVRFLATQYDEVHIINWTNNSKHLTFVYRDNPNIKFFFMPPPASTRQAKLRIARAYNSIVVENPEIEFEPFQRHYYSSRLDWKNLITKFKMPQNTIWQKLFYRIVDVPYEKRYENFNIPRDHEAEEKLFKDLKLPEKYIFACDGISTHNYNLKWGSSIPVINPASDKYSYGSPPLIKDTLIFDWCKVLENAEEIHTVDTVWLHLTRMLQLKVPKFYYKIRKVLFSSGADYLNDCYDSGWTVVTPSAKEFTSRPQD